MNGHTAHHSRPTNGKPSNIKGHHQAQNRFNATFSLRCCGPINNIPTTIARFFVVVGVGIGVGSLIGFGISYLTQRFDLPLVEQSLTLVSAYGTYIITENFGGSGVIGVVTVGVILGNFGSRIGMNPRTRLIVT